jgi:hypothetical protein
MNCVLGICYPKDDDLDYVPKESRSGGCLSRSQRYSILGDADLDRALGEVSMAEGRAPVPYTGRS